MISVTACSRTFMTSMFVFKVLVKFFNRTIMWEKEQDHSCVSIGGESENVKNIEGKSAEVGFLSSQGIRNLSEAKLKTLIKNFK